MTDQEIHERAINAAEEVIASLLPDVNDRTYAMGRGLEAFKMVAKELATDGVPRIAVSAALAAALKYSETFWELHDQHG